MHSFENGNSKSQIRIPEVDIRFYESGVLEKLKRAMEAREAIRAAGTDALRLVDGHGDGLRNREGGYFVRPICGR
jgi:hypothetical protein